MNIQTTDQPTKGHVEKLLAGLVGFNDSVAPTDYRDLGVSAFEDGEFIGGAYGVSGWDWVHVRYVWVDERRRRTGVGTRLLDAVEAKALARHCVGIHLDTFSFQALPFYLKRGFSIFGTITDHPRGGRRYFLQKILGGG